MSKVFGRMIVGTLFLEEREVHKILEEKYFGSIFAEQNLMTHPEKLLLVLLLIFLI